MGGGKGTSPRPPLPLVGGAAPSRQRLPPGTWATVLDFLLERFPRVGPDVWLARMGRGEVVDERGHALGAASPYRAGACVFYYREPGDEPDVPFAEHVIYRDDHLLVADKPHFLPVAPAGRFLRETLLARLRRAGAPDALAPAHRLDRETAGLVVFSLDPSTRGAYATLFQRREVLKVYEALAPARADLRLPATRRTRIVRGEPFFRMKEIEGEPNSETHIDAAGEHDDGVTLYRLRPVTGRKHQLRLHLAGLGVPVLNERLYPSVRDDEEDFTRPLKLLARSLTFRDPVTGREHHFESARKL